MTIYVESNYVLELALKQEESEACECVLRLCEKACIRLVVPAYCLAEPHETLTRRHRQRKSMKDELDGQLGQIARTATNAAQLKGFHELTDLLITSAEQANRNLSAICSRILQCAEIIPLSASVLNDSSDYQRMHDFSPQDALVYASIRSHLERSRQRKSYFLCRDRHFDDQDVLEELLRYNCELVPRFDLGYQVIDRDLGAATGSE